MGRTSAQVLSSVYVEAQDFSAQKATIPLITFYNSEEPEESS
jgi:hypothetical protein